MSTNNDVVKYTIRGILNKTDELRIPAIENKIDVIGVAESWLSDNVIDAELCIDGYKLYQKDRLQVKPGREGGILLYVKNKIVFWECAVTVAKLMHW